MMRDALTDAVMEYARLTEITEEYDKSARHTVPSIMSTFGIPKPTSRELAEAWQAVVTAAVAIKDTRPPFTRLETQ